MAKLRKYIIYSRDNPVLSAVLETQGHNNGKNSHKIETRVTERLHSESESER